MVSYRLSGNLMFWHLICVILSYWKTCPQCKRGCLRLMGSCCHQVQVSIPSPTTCREYSVTPAGHNWSLLCCPSPSLWSCRYDNEWGYSQRVLDLAELTAQKWE